MHRSHPLAEKQQIFQADLRDYVEIAHGDTFRQSESRGSEPRRRIYSVDRLAQVRLLHAIAGAYIWISPASEEDLRQWGLVQRDCADNTDVYRDALLHRKSYIPTDMESGLLELISQDFQGDVISGTI